GDKIKESNNAGIDEIQTTVLLSNASANVENYTFLLDASINFTGNGLDNKIIGNVENDILNGAGGQDALIGNDGDDVLDGGAGADTLNGGAGNDQMTGGAGNDVYYVDSADDQVIEAAGGGVDEIRTTVSLSTTIANVENYTFLGLDPVDFTGDAANNRITGTANSDVLSGGLGNDTIDGRDAFGSDTLNGNEGNDTLISGFGFDILNGGTGNDTLSSGAGFD